MAEHTIEELTELLTNPEKLNKMSDFEKQKIVKEAEELLKKHDIDTRIEKLFYEVGKIVTKSREIEKGNIDKESDQ